MLDRFLDLDQEVRRLERERVRSASGAICGMTAMVLIVVALLLVGFAALR